MIQINNKRSDEESYRPNRIIIGICLFSAVTLCSSAGVVFDKLTSEKSVPPFLAAFWRLFLQNVVQLIPFLLSFRRLWEVDVKQRSSLSYMCTSSSERNEFTINQAKNVNAEETLGLINPTTCIDRSTQSLNRLSLSRYFKSLPLLILSGVSLGIHFSMWVYSLRYTSITHSLLWVSMSPIVLNIGSWILYIIVNNNNILTRILFALSPFPISNVKKPTWLETFGAAAGISGAMILLLDIKGSEVGKSIFFYHKRSVSTDNDIVQQMDQVQNSNHRPSIFGDVAAFSGAIAVCIYLVIGKKLRSWLPIWLYMFPVIGFASLTCLIFSFLDGNDRATWKHCFTNTSVFGFLSKEYFFYALYLGVGPGIFGHTMLSTLLKYISPLVVSTAMLSEPITGSVIGHIFGMQQMPGFYTWIGGVLLLVGLVLVVVGENNDSIDTSTLDYNISYEKDIHVTDEFSTRINEKSKLNDVQNEDSSTIIEGEYGSFTLNLIKMNFS